MKKFKSVTWFQDGKELPKKANEEKEKVFISPLEKRPTIKKDKQEKLYF